MRQKFREEEKQRASYRVPVAATSVGVPVTQAAEATTARHTTKKKERTKRRIGARQVIAGMFALLFLPWFPPATSQKLVDVPTGPSATEFYNALPVVSGKTRNSAHRASGFTAAEWAQWNELIRTASTGHALPENYHDADGLRTYEQVRMHVDKNRAALDKLSEALALPYTYGGVHDLRPYVGGKLRDLAVARFHEGLLLANEGKHAEAANAALDVAAIGVQSTQARSLHTYFLGEFCQARALEALERSLPHLTAAEARTAAARMEELLAKRPSLAEVLEGEKDQQVRLMAFYRYPGMEGNLLSRIPLARAANQYLVMHLEAEMDKRITAVRHPSATTLAVLNQELSSLDPLRFSFFPMGKVYESYMKRQEKTDVLLRALKARTQS